MPDQTDDPNNTSPTPPGDLAQGTRVPPSSTTIAGWPPTPLEIAPVDVNLQPSGIAGTNVQALWALIHGSTTQITFAEYNNYLETVVCGDSANTNRDLLHGVNAYQVLRTATEAFLLLRCGTRFSTALEQYQPTAQEGRFGGKIPNLAELLQKYLAPSPDVLPYIDRITTGLDIIEGANPFCSDDIPEKILRPCFLELIWSYWEEEGMLVQAMNAISLRFQNKRGPGERDPLAALELHPLRPLANVLWGYIQDEDHRLTVARRAYEYEHQYGLTLVGKAVPMLRVADRRSKFLEGFHNLLHQAAIFYDRAANLTFRPDGFPLLNSLREVHMLLAEGAHNQFRDLPWTARVEMLIQQWLLSRREIRDFLGSRPAVPYAEPWMATVDTIKRLMNWNDTAVTQFHDLAIHGEQILLSIRYGDWSAASSVEDDARGWAQFWKNEIQRYIHAYHAVTGVDLGAVPVSMSSREIDATQPSVLLRERLARQRPVNRR